MTWQMYGKDSVWGDIDIDIDVDVDIDILI